MKNIAIVMGGYSSEHDISLKSGTVVHQYLDKSQYKSFPIHITLDGWFYAADNGERIAVNKNDFSITVNGVLIKFDAVFNAVHGTPGEDGLLQAYFDLLNLPQSSCGYYQAALTFNKRDLLSVLRTYGIKTAKSYYLNEGDTLNESDIIDAVGLPCFVKPNRSGSSFGISKVKSQEDLHSAIERAFQEDDEIIIEEFLDGVEVSVGVITYHDDILVLPITEIVSENEFFDYEAKYLGKSQEITPARLSQELAQKISKTAKKIYSILKMTGFSRSEFIIVNDEPYLLEMNTIPGLTTESILPQQAHCAGISLTELFGNAIEQALVRTK
jgi:D-alanine-D-alanine ligase